MCVSACLNVAVFLCMCLLVSVCLCVYAQKTRARQEVLPSNHPSSPQSLKKGRRGGSGTGLKCECGRLHSPKHTGICSSGHRETHTHTDTQRETPTHTHTKKGSLNLSCKPTSKT